VFNIWEVIEELVGTADEQGIKQISVSRIGKELKDAGENNAQNIQAVKKILGDLGYRIGQ
jgi:hypothetical protein